MASEISEKSICIFDAQNEKDKKEIKFKEN